MDEREDPRRRLRALGEEARCAAPHREEALLHGVLCERPVAEHPHAEPVRDAAVAVVKLAERGLVRPRDEGDDRLVGEVCQVA